MFHGLYARLGAVWPTPALHGREMVGGRMERHIVHFLRDQRGTESVEWGVVSGVIIAALVTVFAGIGGFVLGRIQGVDDQLNP